MADIKTRDAVKGTIKTIDKAAIAGGHMKSAYAKTKDKSEHSYYTEGNSPAEYASDKITRTSGNVSEKGVRQFNKQGQKSVQITKKNIVKAKDKVSELKTKRAIKAANQRKAQTVAEQKKGLAIHQGTTNHSPTLTYNNKSHIIKFRHQEKKAIKTSIQNADTAVKFAAKGTIKTTKKSIKTSQTTSKAAIKTTKSSVKTARTSAKTAQKAAQTAKPQQRQQLKRQKQLSRLPLPQLGQLSQVQRL